MRWIKAKKAAALLDCGEITIKRRRIPFGEQPTKGRIRFKDLVLDEHSKPRPRFFLQDLMTLLKCPVPLEKILYSPIYTAPRPEARFHDSERVDGAEPASMMRIVTAAEYLDVSRDAIEDRLIDWVDDYVPFRIRYSNPEEHGLGYRLCYAPDVCALLQNPRPQEPAGVASRFHTGD